MLKMEQLCGVDKSKVSILFLTFKNVLPNYGLTYKFETIPPYIEWLWKKFESGEIVVTNPLNLKVTIQESCYGKMFGDDYMDLPRKILTKIGCEVIEMPATRENMKCCGVAAGFSVDAAYHTMKMRSATCDNLTMAKKTGAEVMCVYCSGCNQTYHIAKKLYFKRFGMEIFHLIELIQMSIGETPARLIGKTASNIFGGVIKNQVPKLYSKKTFKLTPVSEDPAEEGY